MANGHKSAAHTDSPDGGASNCKTCLGGGPMLIVFLKKNEFYSFLQSGSR